MAPLTLRLADDLHEALRDAAEASGRSLQREIEWRLRGSFNHTPEIRKNRVSTQGAEGTVDEVSGAVESPPVTGRPGGGGEREGRRPSGLDAAPAPAFKGPDPKPGKR